MTPVVVIKRLPPRKDTEQTSASSSQDDIIKIETDYSSDFDVFVDDSYPVELNSEVNASTIITNNGTDLKKTYKRLRYK